MPILGLGFSLAKGTSVSSAAAEPTDETYLPSSTGNTAWKVDESVDTVRPPTTLAFDNETEYTGGELTTISTDNTSGVVGGAQYGGTKIRFTLPEDAATIDQIDIAIAVSDDGMGGPFDMSIYIWNFLTTTWDDTGQGVTSSTKSALAKQYTSSITDYVDESGNLYIAALSEAGGVSHAPTVYFSSIRVQAGTNTDSVPDAFSFTDATGANPSTQTSSNIIQIVGLDAVAAISVTGDGSPEYRICADGACSGVSHDWSTAARYIENNEYVQVRLTSNASFETANSATLTIGGVTDVYSVTTAVEDTTPNAFSFTDATDSAVNTVISSNIIQIDGINSAATVSIAGDGSPQYRICADGACSSVAHDWSSSAGSITNNEYIQVRLTSSSSNETALSTTLTIGGVTDNFSVTTEAAGPTDVTYEPNDTGNTAWKVAESSDYVRPPNALIVDQETEYSGAELNTISTDNTSGVTGLANYGGSKIRYTIPEAAANVTQLDVKISVSDDGMGGPNEMTLYIWNFDTTTWDDSGQDTTSATKSELNYSITTSITDYIDGSGNVYIAALSAAGGASHAPIVYYSSLRVQATA